MNLDQEPTKEERARFCRHQLVELYVRARTHSSGVTSGGELPITPADVCAWAKAVESYVETGELPSA